MSTLSVSRTNNFCWTLLLFLESTIHIGRLATSTLGVYRSRSRYVRDGEKAYESRKRGDPWFRQALLEERVRDGDPFVSRVIAGNTGQILDNLFFLSLKSLILLPLVFGPEMLDSSCSAGVKAGPCLHDQAVAAEPGRLRYNKRGLTKDGAGPIHIRKGR
jgi:hypothetical protein